MDMPNIKYKGDLSKFIEAQDDEEAILYFKDNEYFLEDSPYSRFIKEVEKVVRKSSDYTAFVDYIKNTLGINFCQVSSKIYASQKVQIEMHHGPLFTLYDVCEVMLNWFLKNSQRINTFRVADKVLEEHYAMRVQVIMLSVTNHEGVHNRDIFTHFNQGIGDLNSFIKLYAPYFTDEQKYKIWNFMDICNATNFGKSFDTGLLDVDNVKKFIKL